MSADYPPEPHPPMRCGACGGPLVYEPSKVNPEFGSYTHDGPVMDRHGAYPVEIWSSVDEIEVERWTRWRPPTWEFPPLPGVVINPTPPEPPVGTRLAPADLPDAWSWERTENGWRRDVWTASHGVQWEIVLVQSGPLIAWQEPGAPAPGTDETEER